MHRVGHTTTVLFPELEDQYCEWQPGMPSPDRLDAAVWGYTYLMVDPESQRISVVGED
jgi:phage terminase large subunit-like protein